MHQTSIDSSFQNKVSSSLKGIPRQKELAVIHRGIS